MNRENETIEIKRTKAFASLAHLDLGEVSGGAAKRFFPVIVLGVFFAVLILGLTSGVVVYTSISQSAAQSDAQRQGASLISNAVRANDATNAIAVGEGPEGRSLVIRETLNSGTYETRFYLYQGEILQEYSIEDAAYTPEKATVVMESTTFDFKYSHGLLTITTDDGASEIALRSTQGGGYDA